MAQQSQPSLRTLLESLGPQYDNIWLSLQWHAGFAGMGKGWDKAMTAEIARLGEQGYTLVSAVQQKDPTWFILFFTRQVR
jgi:hypothetical protein